MRISARADYAVRAAPELAVRRHGGPVKAEVIAAAQGIPHQFLEGILGDLRRGGPSPAGAAAAAATGSRAPPRRSPSPTPSVRWFGPIVSLRGERPTQPAHTGPAEPLLPLRAAVRANVRKILEGVSPADIAEGAPAGRCGGRRRG
jgi:hypothetical protein